VAVTSHYDGDDGTGAKGKNKKKEI